jgi:hypothetical protein
LHILAGAGFEDDGDLTGALAEGFGEVGKEVGDFVFGDGAEFLPGEGGEVHVQVNGIFSDRFDFILGKGGGAGDV